MAKSFPFDKKFIWIGIAVIAVLAIIFTIWGSYNTLVQLNQNVDKTWADVEAQYQRRFDLIPNLVSTVQSYAGFEKSTLTQIIELRTQWQAGGTVNQQIQTANQFESTLSKLLLITENYPQLKASSNFLSLQDSLSETENMVSVARTRYNDAVRGYNTATLAFPSNIIAGWFGFTQKDYFNSQAGAENAPKVNITVP